MISKQEVQHIAKLARLDLSDKELEKMQNELAVILDYIDMLKKADVSLVQTSEHSVGLNLKNVLRKDIEAPEATETIESIKKQFPDKKDDLVKVKQVLN